MLGALLGIGHHKGYGLALMTDVLTGVISGGGYGLVPYADPAHQDVAHTMIAIDIAWFMPVEEFKARMDDFVRMCKSAELRPGFDEILVPGEIDYRRETDYRRNGARLDAVIFDELKALAGTLGIDFPFQREVAA
jgi:LDH2 family malate/lactate/ureidoglycolate dehydrogenase